MRMPRVFGLILVLAMALSFFTVLISVTKAADSEEERGPSDITLTVTVGVTPGVCAATETLSVVSGTIVTYCYTVTNSGPMTLPLHALSDSQFGLLFDDLAYDLGPGGSVDSIALGYAPTATIAADLTTSATWTAYKPGPGSVNTATDDATVLLVPDLELQKTVGVDFSSCATSDSIVVPVGATVYYCYTVTNNTAVTRTTHGLIDSELGLLLSGFSFDLGPGASIDTVALGLSVNDVIVTDTINVATWTAYNLGPTDAISATSAATVALGVPAIQLTKTVGNDPASCASSDSYELPPYGGTVYYCYTVENTGNVTLPLHTLDDSELGNLFTGFSYDLAPGESADTVSAGIEVSATLTSMTVNTATWTVSSLYGSADAVAVATVTIAPIMLDVELTKTVGTDPDTCATTDEIEVGPDTPVYFCYTVENTGNFTVTLHNLVDSELGVLLTAFPLPLGPGQAISSADIGGLTFSQTLTATTVNTATWTASTTGWPDTAMSTDTATVIVTYRTFLPAIFKE
jgi:hypothetical protein